ncbi:sacsin-like [Littorina saxatilis]|uniref:HEPN domain-containing protein n=1 Tax=Littorina saxatilis TaxID=31220 RepID=A0AAN9AJ33_9CAEN
MSSDSQDSEGEDLSTIRPTLIRELRNVLDLYPDDGQILKELIQNAEDAGATEVKVLTDTRTFHQDLDKKTLKNHPHLKFLKGPAMCVYNDAEFTKDDWEGIRMLHTSIKEKDPLKVGRFGLGFKSVFHLTDRLVIMSGEYIMYMDPFKGETHYCSLHRLAGRKGRELQSLLHSLNGVFGVSEATFRAQSGHFPGTLFWFPLRQEQSELSSTVYSDVSVGNLLASFKAESPSLLLFLNHIQRVNLYTRGDTQRHNETFSVGISSSCLTSVLSQRQRFVRDTTAAGSDLPRQDIFCLTEVVMETKDHLKSSTESQRWLVANYHCGKDNISRDLLRLCLDPQLGYRPCVGVAIPLTNQSDFQSQVFCFLPLPLDTRSPTGLPLHVHGYFSLEQNRRHLKWPTADQLRPGRDRAKLEPPTLWNCLLVTELLPRVYSKAVCRLQELNCGDPDTFYQAWPDARTVSDRWGPLLEPLYADLAQRHVFFSHVQGGRWVSLSQAVLQQQLPPEVKEAVLKVYTVNDENLVDLPKHVLRTLNSLGHLEHVEKVNARSVSRLIPSSLAHLTDRDKLSLLHYLCCHDQSLLINLPLLPLASGHFGTFKSRQNRQSSVKFCCPEELNMLFPGLEAEFCSSDVPAYVREDLEDIAETGTLAVEKLTKSDRRLPELLQRSLQTRFGSGHLSLNITDPWIERVWMFLENMDDLSEFSHVRLLPVKKVERNPLTMFLTSKESMTLLPLTGVYVCSKARGMTPMSASLASALTKLGVTVLHDVPSYLTRHGQVLGHFVHYPTPDGVMEAVQSVSAKSSLRTNAVKTFNSEATADEKKALVQLLRDCSQSSASVPVVFKQLQLFKAVTGEPASVYQVSVIGPEHLPPVSFPRKLLACTTSEKYAAQKLGAQEMTLYAAVHEIMQDMSSLGFQYSGEDKTRLMRYFLQNYTLCSNTSLQSMARQIEFVTTASCCLRRVVDVYDPSSSLLQELFHTQHDTLFPSGEFCRPEMLQKLQSLGLRGERDVQNDLVSVAKQISDQWSGKQYAAASKMSCGLWKYLKNYGHVVSAATLQSISTIPCLLCLQDDEKPFRVYPASLPLKPSPKLVKPSEMCSNSLLTVIGSVLPILRSSDLPMEVALHLQVKQHPAPADVLQHLKNVTHHFCQEEIIQYRPLLIDIFQYLRPYKSDISVTGRLADEKCVLVESGDQFAKPCSLWIEKEESDLNLQPYRFSAPVEMTAFRDFLGECGSAWSQDDDMLLAVLEEIQSKYKEQKSAHPDFSRDLQLVGQILSRLKLSETARGGKTLLPIEHKQPGVLRFKPARECTVLPGVSATNTDSSSETYFYVHRDVAVQTALDLGALLMKDRALTGVEGLGLDFEYGQHEDLINRLHGIVKDSYTDGFSVPKELVQNADDARATKVCFLLDERENQNARTNLIDEGMAGLQGPAIWAYNDGVFSETDFENIVKLGAGTKKDDASKVGRFGLGFNAVYNLTDVPCFISKDKMAMFDPQCKYLGKGAGLKLDFTKPINKDLLTRMPNQFLPFQNVFGCSLQHNAEVSYEGTLFRFPLRTAEQAKESKLKSESYSESKPREFLKMLLDRAGSLLMFTQSVTKLEVFHLPSSCSDPREAKLLLTVRKNNCLPPTMISEPAQLGAKSVLRFMKDEWSWENRDIKIKQIVKIDLKVTDEASSVCGVKKTEGSTMWQIAWASGVDESAKLAHRYRQEGLVPLAAVSVLVSDNSLLALKDSPAGFYDTGHLFCFLPLPEELARVTLPVHINGTFALTSDRRSLVVNIEEEFEKWEASWNCALYGDAICRAYLLALELVQKEAAGGSDFSKYFDLWPMSSVDSLVESFYNHLLTGNNKVLPVPCTRQWVTFQDACFLQPNFRDSGCGKTAWMALREFWIGPGHVVDVPSDICKLMKKKGPKGMFGKKVISELAFYRDFFFPNLHSDWWQPDERDSLIHHALMRRDTDIDELIRVNACIPCEGGQQLRKPSELVHPRGQAAKLFLPCECRFPQKKDETQTTSTRTDFCDDNTSLLRLAFLGMIKDEMPWDMVLDRAGTVGQLNVAKKTADCLSRAASLIEYLSTSRAFDSEFAFENCPSEVKASLSQTAFLPVLSKPDDWPFQWAGDEPAECVLLSPPSQLFSDSLKNLVACKEKLLDTRCLQGSKTLLTGKVREMLKGLGVAVEEDYGRGQLLDAVLQQLLAVAEHHCINPTSNKELVQSISTNVYAYLTTCLRRDEQHNLGEHVHEFLSDKDVVWNGTQFVSSSLVVFVCPFNCSPYLFKLESNLQGYRHFFEAVGVKQSFEASDVISVLQILKRENDGIQIPDETITIVSQLALLLGAITKRSPQNESLDKSQVFLPDKHGILQPATRLCVDDCLWLTESEHLKFVHDKIPTETARLLGVKTKRSQDYDMLTESISVPFGQHEELTTRIKRLLQGYTFDSSLCKELLQNAEDAGATECKFIMDFRHLKTDTVPPNWNALQGPALCFYNNKSFTKQDMEGIQNLGVGSKGGDALKIGQFGVGFNAVFHITDVPSFWTREDDEKEVICVLDPNCTNVPGAQPSDPGKKFIKIQHMKREYPDFISAYLSEAINMNQPGTLFRFPLRTTEMAASSSIKHEAIRELDIKSMLDKFMQEIHPCLLFLNNMQKIGIFSVQRDGSLKKEFEVNKTLDELSVQQLSTFKKSLKEASRLVENETVSVTDIPPLEAVVQLELTDSSGHREQWLTVHKIGFAEEVCLTPKLQSEWCKENFRLLPRGGVAVKVADETQQNKRQTTSQLEHQVFCILPLPVYTMIPMHVNGHFALDHETRRNLWDAGSHKDDVRSEWNEAIVLHVVLPAYITALQQLQDVWFPAGGRDLSKQELSAKLQRYHALFPLVKDAKSDLWKQLMHAVYATIAKNEYPIFPVLCPEQQELEWMPVTKKGGFPGYFNNLVAFFKDLQAKTSQVTLTVGRSTPASHATPSGPSPREIAKQFEVLLKKLNMKILEAPFHVFECFKASGVDDVREVTPQSVLQFLVSVDQGFSTGCNLDNLPKPVADTSLESPDKVWELVSFVSKGLTFLDNLDGIPLCLRQSGTLHKFSSSENAQKPIISEYSQLLPGSAKEFLHKHIIMYFSIPEKTKPVLQQLTIEMLACRLKYTLTEPQYCAGKHCELEQEKLPYALWIKDLWKFLESQIKSELRNNRSSNDTAHKDFREEKKSERRELREIAESMLESLREWCVLPVTKKNGTHEKRFLYPLKDMHRVVHLSYAQDETNSRLWVILGNLPLPMLDKASLLGLSIANDLVASICHPRALLHALVTCVQLSASHEDGCTILDYFGKNLKTLMEMCTDEAELKQELRSLPLFPSVGGNLVSIPGNVSVLCLNPSVPEEGLMQWSSGRDRSVFLLRREHLPKDLVGYLGLTALKTLDFYSQYLLPTLAALPRQSILTHMKFLKDSVERELSDENVKYLVMQLRSTAFVEVQGTLYRAQDFFNPHFFVFGVMCTRDQFPPAPYCTREWEGFMKAAGMVNHVSADLFVEYAHSVANEGKPQITQSVQKKSETLVGHLFSRKDLTNGCLLADVKDIQFLLPSDWRSSREGQGLLLIAQPFCPPRLVSFAESCFEQHVHLVWSSSCILHSYADPQIHCRNKEQGAVMHQLGLQQKPPKQTVVQHLRNVAQTLASERGPEIFAALEQNKRRLIVVMEELYGYLENNMSNSDIRSLSQLPVICDIDNSQMLTPSCVVIDLRPTEMIKGHIEKAPLTFGRYFNLFQKLGVVQCVTANHYAVVLAWLKNETGNEELHVEEMKIVKTAVEGLFRCLKFGDEKQKQMEVPTLYLPTEEMILQMSTEIMYKDSRFGSRFQDCPTDMHFFLGFKLLEISVSTPLEEVALLPRNHRMTMLSDVVKEVIPDETKNNSTEGECSRDLMAKLHHPNATAGIIRLMYHTYYLADCSFGEQTAVDVQGKLSHVSAREITGLKTMLAINDRTIPGSELLKPSFTEKIHGTPRRAVVYLDTEAAERSTNVRDPSMHSLALAIMFVLKTDLNELFLNEVLHSPESAMTTLDDYDVAMCDFSHVIEDSVIPTAGTFVPVRHHDHLDNSICKFDPKEHVGFEVYDPDVEGENREGGDAVYIYAVVLREITAANGGADVPLIARRYRIYLGTDRGIAEVSVTQIYKFKRRARRSTSTALVESEAQDSEEEFPIDIIQVLNEIRKLFNDTWRQLSDDKDRRRVVKRLLLKWHPDKNPGRQEFCTQVTQKILQYVDILNSGRDLPDDQDLDDVDGAPRNHGSSFPSSFYAHMNARAQSHRAYSESTSSSQSGPSQRTPNPQPGEGRRWFRQAEADVTSARDARGASDRGRNWICYQCHQAVEKALKAVLYSRDADGFNMMSHKLPQLAQSVGDSELLQLAQVLESRLGPHTRMRYPDVTKYPRVPADEYSEDDVSWACGVASRVVDRVQSLI